MTDHDVLAAMTINGRCPCGLRLDLARGPEHATCRGEKPEPYEHPNEAHNARTRARRKLLKAQK